MRCLLSWRAGVAVNELHNHTNGLQAICLMGDIGGIEVIWCDLVQSRYAIDLDMAPPLVDFVHPYRA
jgi:hypothetical protein